MKFISHRGNLSGKSDKENEPVQIVKCLELGYDVEIDVWAIDGNLFLGHDEPQHRIEIEFLKNDRLWCHAKNSDALQTMLQHTDIHCFWHQNDDYTLTSKSVTWVFPGKDLSEGCVAVMPELCSYSIDSLHMCAGICSDQIQM